MLHVQHCLSSVCSVCGIDMEPTFGQLRDVLLSEFTEAEVASLCGDMGLDYEQIPGTGFFGKTRGLISTMQQQGRQNELMTRVRRLRPRAFNPDLELTDADESDDYTGDDSPDVDDEPVHHQKQPARNVARETTQEYDIVPQPRVLMPLILIAVVVVLAGLVVFLPGILQRGLALPSLALPTASLPTPTSTSSIPVVAVAAASSTPRNTQGVIVLATRSVPLETSAPTMPVIATRSQAVPIPAFTAEVNAQPAAQFVADANALLPAYYKGEIGADKIAAAWSGQAYKATIGWNKKLAAVLKLGNTLRSTLEITYEFVKQPLVTAIDGDTYTVASREYWSYANPARQIQTCETRDYTYTVVKTTNGYSIRASTGALINKNCR
ncbi:MAG: hypothetical protein NTZ50_07440 [Chloroflexi bacterium]|nr:hypothetical protein [Chloroflexota bacterium]